MPRFRHTHDGTQIPFPTTGRARRRHIARGRTMAGDPVSVTTIRADLDDLDPVTPLAETTGPT